MFKIKTKATALQKKLEKKELKTQNLGTKSLPCRHLLKSHGILGFWF